MRATDQILKPIASTHWLVDGMPRIRRIGPSDTPSGADWIGLRANGAYRVTAVEQQQLLPVWAALVLLLATWLFAWRMEGR